MNFQFYVNPKQQSLNNVSSLFILKSQTLGSDALEVNK